MQALAGGIGAVVGCLLGIAQLAGYLGDIFGSDPPPPHLGGRLTAIDMLPNITLGEFLARERRPAVHPDRARQNGNVVSVRVRIRGYEGRMLPLRWTVYDNDTGKRLRGDDFEHVGLRFRPRGPDHAARGRVWVPNPARDGSYVIRLALEDPEGGVLDERQTKPFDIAAP